ncbi:hypothetical protein K9M47_02290 [Candidatus Gracilibacteria bacterium]|nr:hypothetical protein [Candidatus Gracilibacteria bacterium]MCF7898496.1 hypothetical protein [Candidatus Paceibacterota bacterium]
MSFFKNLGDELGTATGKGISVFISAFWKVTCVYLSYLCKIERVPGEHIMHTNSFRIANWSLIIAILFVPGLVTCSFRPADIVNNKILNPGGVYLKINLSDRPPSFFPNSESFRIDNAENIQHYRNFDNMRLFSYHQRQSENFPTIIVDGKLCAVVPAGRKIGFKSLSPPVYAANMKNEVVYFIKMSELSFLRKQTALYYYLMDYMDGLQRTSNPWKDMVNEWSKVETGGHKIIATALDKKDIPDGVLGGMVCF